MCPGPFKTVCAKRSFILESALPECESRCGLPYYHARNPDQGCSLERSLGESSDRSFSGLISTWVFRDVVFQDVGFEHNNISKPLTHISYRCEVPTPSVVEDQSTIMLNPHILKHHIPEIPIYLQAGGKRPAAGCNRTT